MTTRRCKLALVSAAIAGLTAVAVYPASARIALNGASLNGISLNRISLNRIALNTQSTKAHFDAQGVKVQSVTLPNGIVLTAR